MNTFWIILCAIIFAFLSIEPIGYLLIRRTKTIYVKDSRRIQYHSGDMITSIYIVEDEDDNIYLSDKDVPTMQEIEITYKGFDIPKFGLIRKIINIKPIK